MWQRKLQHRWNQTKSFVHQGYHTLSGWARNFDRAATIGKRLFSLAVPALQDIGGEEVVSRGAAMIGKYNQFRNEVGRVDRNLTAYGQAVDSADIFA